MRRGVDTTFLVQVEVAGHPGHGEGRAKTDELLAGGDTLVLAPQVLAEFVHVVTDPRRFSSPLSVDAAVERAQLWWNAAEVAHAFPDHDSVSLFLGWMRQHGLGRRRLLGTLLAATYFSRGIRSIISSNVRHYTVFDCFDMIAP